MRAERDVAIKHNNRVGIADFRLPIANRRMQRADGVAEDRIRGTGGGRRIQYATPNRGVGVGGTVIFAPADRRIGPERMFL